MALIALIQRANLRSRGAQIALVLLGVFGASLFYGDGMITPAISVLSAVEGLEVVDAGPQGVRRPDHARRADRAVRRPALRHRRASARCFGPVMVLWFGVLALSGLRPACSSTRRSSARSRPTTAPSSSSTTGTRRSSRSAASCSRSPAPRRCTPTWATSARRAIRRGWFALVFPALILNYLGQGALILERPERERRARSSCCSRSWARIPMVILSTVAAIIASQAVICGAFCVTRQAIRLGFLPRLVVRHTSREEVGQVYVPAANWIIFAAVVALVRRLRVLASGWRSAYGIAVTGTLAIDTLLFFFVVRALWHRPLWLVIAGAIAFLIVDLTFFAANLTKVLHGGWFPLAIALAVFSVLTTWQRGREIVTPPPDRGGGPAARLRRGGARARPARRPRARHRRVPQRQPGDDAAGAARQRRAQPRAARVRPDRLADHRARALRPRGRAAEHRRPRLPRRRHHPHHRPLRLPGPAGRAGAAAPGGAAAASRATRSSSTRPTSSRSISIIPTDRPGMATWRKKLFLAISRNAANPVEVFHLPDERTVVMGSHIEL